MSDYDTSIRVSTKVDNSGLKDTEKEIEDIKDRLESAKKRADALEDAGAIDTEAYKEAKRDVEKWTEALDKNIVKQKEAAKAALDVSQTSMATKTRGDFNSLSDVVEDYETRLKYLRDQGLGLGDEEYDKLYIAWKNASDAEKEYAANLNKLTDKSIADEEAKITREKEKQGAEALKLQGIRSSAVVANQQLVNLMQEATQLEARKAELKKAGITDGYKEYDEINARLIQIKQEIEHQKTGFKKMGDSAKKAFKKVDEGAKKSGGLLKTFTSRLKGITLSLLVFNWITKGFNAMVSAMKEGFNNLVQYSDKYNDAMSQLKSAGTQLKNSIATAFAPIVTTAIPYLLQLINCLTAAANKVSEFMAIMSGASSWTRAVAVQEDYAESLKNTASASKKAAGALAAFDTINVLSKNDNGSGTSGVSPKDMFEEVPIEKKDIKLFDDLIEKLEKIKDLFSTGFGEGIGDIGIQMQDIIDNFDSIRESLISIFADGEITDAAKKAFEKIIIAIGQTTGSYAQIATTIAQNLVGGIGTYLEENKDYIKEKIKSIFDISGDISEIIGKASVAISNIFSVFGEENGQQLTGNLIGIFTNAFLELGVIVLSLARDILDIITRPFIDNQEEFKTAFDGILGTAATVTGTLKDAVDATAKKIDEVYQKYFKPFFNSIAEGLSTLTSHFLKFWNEDVQPLLDEWAGKFDVLWKEHIQPMIDNFLELIGKVSELLMVLWEEYLVPIIAWIIDNVLPELIPIFDGIMERAMIVYETISDVISGIIDYLSGIIEFLIGVFTGDWKRAWKGITDIFEGVKNTLKSIINGILGFVEAFANGVVDAINKVIRALNNLSFDIPDWIPEIGGNKFGFNISEISRISIPRLADGAVLRGGNPFAAIVNDQPFGQTNVETPLSTIEDAVRNVMGERTGSLNINLNYDGETFARLSLHDILAEMEREGYDIDVLGGT